MTTAADIITAGFRENNLIPVGKQPTEAERIEGLQVLNRHLDAMFGYVVGESLADWPVPPVQRTGTVAANPPLFPGSNAPIVQLNPSYPPQNVRIVWDGSERTVYFPEKPNDGARMALVRASGATAANSGTLTLDGNGRTIEGANTYTGGESGRRWFYRADLADWVALVPLGLNDQIPFPPEYDDYWICCLAVRLSPRYGKTIQTGTIDTLKRMKAQIQARYAQEAPGTAGGLTLYPSHQSYDQGWFDLL